MGREEAPDTRERILAAAGGLFAERGFLATTMREIAERAGANLAAAHYHFGSKQDLYLEVVRAQFERMQAQLVARGASRPGETLDALSRVELETMLRSRVETMLETALDPVSIHGRVMMHEMAHPSEALPVIVEQFIEPQRSEMARIVARLAPELSPADVEHCTRSIVGQSFFYLTHRPALLLLMGRKDYPRDFVREAAGHITAFTLGGLERLVASPHEPSRARRVAALRAGGRP
jgi:AcrR family transcriptional regulator